MINPIRLKALIPLPAVFPRLGPCWSSVLSPGGESESGVLIWQQTTPVFVTAELLFSSYGVPSNNLDNRGF